MSYRQLRVNELIKREVSMLLRTYFRSEAVLITITRVEVAPDLRAGKIFFSVLGDKQQYRKSGQFLAKNKSLIRRLIGKNIRLKYLPYFEFIPDHSIEEAMRVIDLIDSLQPEEDLAEVSQESTEPTPSTTKLRKPPRPPAKPLPNP